jgi:hypothetical protein
MCGWWLVERLVWDGCGVGLEKSFVLRDGWGYEGE